MVETRSWRQRTQSLETFQINYWLFRRCEWDKNVSGWLMILWTPRGLNGTQMQGVICNFNSKLINVEHVWIFVHFFMHLCWCMKKKKNILQTTKLTPVQQCWRTDWLKLRFRSNEWFHLQNFLDLRATNQDFVIVFLWFQVWLGTEAPLQL